MDLQLLDELCQKIDPVKLFAQDPCPFEQPVLLSLLQQLGSDVATHPQLKLRYP